MSLGDKILAMSPDCRRMFARKHKKQLHDMVYKGGSLEIMPEEVVTVTRDEMLSFGVRHRILDRPSLERTLKEHPEAGFSIGDISCLFKSCKSYLCTVRDNLGFDLNGRFVSFEDFIKEVRKKGIRSLKEYKVFSRTEEGRKWPQIIEIRRQFGNFNMFLAVVMSQDLNHQFDMFCRLSVRRGKILTRSMSLRVGVEYDELVGIIGLENLKSYVDLKILEGQSKEVKEASRKGTQKTSEVENEDEE